MGNRWNSRINTDRWEKGFAALSTFRAREGHCCPGQQHVEGNFKLGYWVSVQRYRKGLLPAERKRRLAAIGFVWNWQDYLWEQSFAALLKFKRRKGHCYLSTFHRNRDHKLAWWVATQRRNKKVISAERHERLNKIGFVWTVEMGPIAYRPKVRPRRGGAQQTKSNEFRKDGS